MSGLERSVSLQPHDDGTPEKYDLVIIGSGAGAKVAAWTFAAEGERVALVERK